MEIARGSPTHLSTTFLARMSSRVIQGMSERSAAEGRRNSGVDVKFVHVTSLISQNDGAQKEDDDDDNDAAENNGDEDMI